MQTILIHYGELALKGDNRPFFERRLIQNIKQTFADFNVKLEHPRGRFLLHGNFPEDIARERLQRIFGIANFSFITITKSNIDSIKETLLPLAAEKKFDSFKIDSRRADKSLPFTSRDLNNQLGDLIRTNLKKKVDLENPDLVCFIEALLKESYIYFEKIPGAGGLPVGVSGRVLSLISSGIDSPVASLLMAKRGSEVDFIHFHSYPLTTRQSIENVKKLVEKLGKWGIKGRLFLVPILEIQKILFEKLKEEDKKYLVLLYRFFMLRLAEQKAKEIGAQALVTGDSLGQVASQTIPNMIALDKVTDNSIFRPLIGFDKKEIIDLAQKIDTYDISIRPVEDCCTLFVPKHPETKAEFSKIKKLARKIKKSLIKKAFRNIEEV